MNSFELIKSKRIIKIPPIKKPTATGINERSFQVSSAFSKAGKSKDQIEADNIMPAARPIVIILTIFDVFLKKKTNDAPSVVIRQGRVKSNMIVNVSLIFF